MNTEQEPQLQEEDGELNGLELSALFGGSENWAPDTLVYYGPENRAILVAGDVEPGMANSIISQLLQLDSVSQQPIVMYINTDGGDVHQAFAIYDTMRSIRSQIITVAMGTCMSAGVILLQGGDVRTSMPHTRLMYHEPIATATAFDAETAKAFLDNYDWALSQGKGIITERASLSEEQWEEYFAGKTGMYLTAEEAKELNLLDIVTVYATKNDG